MATRDNLIKVRRVIAEFKIYITRTQSYLAPLQLFMIFLIFLDTTVWKVDTIQLFFGSKTNFIGVGVAIFFVGVLVLGYVDTKLKMFRVEQSRYNISERNPYVRLYTLWTAILLSDKTMNKKRAKSIETLLEPMMKETGIYDEFRRFKNE